MKFILGVDLGSGMQTFGQVADGLIRAFGTHSFCDQRLIVGDGTRVKDTNGTVVGFWKVVEGRNLQLELDQYMEARYAKSKDAVKLVSGSDPTALEFLRMLWERDFWRDKALREAKEGL